MLDLMLVIVGILGLWLGSEVAVRSAGEIGRRLGFSEMFLGLTVFAIGTDISELFVALQGAARQLAGIETSGLVVGNALGSVLAQGGLVLGVVAFFARRNHKAMSDSSHQDAMVWLGAVGLLAVFAWDGRISRLEGALLAIAYATYFVTLLRANHTVDKLRASGDPRRYVLPFLGAAFGLGVVVYSADLAVEHGMRLAERSGIDPAAIGLFALGAGTSLPELAVSLGAAARGRAALSLGNVLGSNTFDLLVPLGFGAMVHPLGFSSQALRFDLSASAILALYFVVRLWTGGGRLDSRDTLALFGAYLGFCLFRVGTVAG